MILSLCFLLLALSPSRQEICSAPGALPAPILYLREMSAQPGDSVLLLCYVFFQVPASRVAFCKDGEEVSSQNNLLGELTYYYSYAVSRGSSGNYSCGYEIRESDNRVTRSQLSSTEHLNLIGSANCSGGAEEPTRTGPAMSPAAWVARCALALLLLVSAPVITFVLEKWDLREPAGLEETREGRNSVMGRRGAESGRTPSTACEQGNFLGRFQCPALSSVGETPLVSAVQ